LPGFFFDPKDGGDTFLQNVSYNSIIFQKTELFITTTVRTSNPINFLVVSLRKNPGGTNAKLFPLASSTPENCAIGSMKKE
jgi:hypothetical protein